MKIQLFGQTAKNLPIFSYLHAQAPPPPASAASVKNGVLQGLQKEILILGGVHGDEIEGVIAARKIMEILMSDIHFSSSLKIPIMIIPEFNPEGVLNKTRMNLHGVDLNRNLPTKDWSPEIKSARYHPGPSANSEPENQALVNYLEIHRVGFILSLHSWHPVINVNGDCLEEAKVLQTKTNYKIDNDIGYPTPGCLGTYTGIERGIPTITYEIERGQSQEDILKMHVPAIRDLLKHLNEKWNRSTPN